MESRSFRYVNNDDAGSNKMTRVSRNSRLYQEVSLKYGDLDNLPLQDNTNEIDIDDLKEIMSYDDKDNRGVSLGDDVVGNKRDVYVDRKRVYDINELLERAKYENNKLKEPINDLSDKNREILETLESKELSLKEIKDNCDRYSKRDDNDLSMTRELKYRNQGISGDSLVDRGEFDNGIGMFDDLKPEGDTIITKPIEDDGGSNDLYSGDTSDIDVIKSGVKKSGDVDDDFYTSSYVFSKNDFNDDDLVEDSRVFGVLKVILLIILIIVFVFVIYYFVKSYGIGI